MVELPAAHGIEGNKGFGAVGIGPGLFSVAVHGRAAWITKGLADIVLGHADG